VNTKLEVVNKKEIDRLIANYNNVIKTILAHAKNECKPEDNWLEILEFLLDKENFTRPRPRGFSDNLYLHHLLYLVAGA
jgi:hypothetical protein